MIFHSPDTSYARLKSCWKRAAKFAAPGQIDPAHPLAPSWANCKMMVDAEQDGRPYTSEDIKEWEKEAVDAAVFSLSCLDWFALKLDEHSKTHMLDGDTSIASMLHEWRERLILDPSRLGPPSDLFGDNVPKPVAVEKKAKPRLDELGVKIEKENARVTYEWLAFEKECPGMWDDMGEECHLKADEINDRQCLRHVQIFGKGNICQVHQVALHR